MVPSVAGVAASTTGGRRKRCQTRPCNSWLGYVVSETSFRTSPLVSGPVRRLEGVGMQTHTEDSRVSVETIPEPAPQYSCIHHGGCGHCPKCHRYSYCPSCNNCHLCDPSHSPGGGPHNTVNTSVEPPNVGGPPVTSPAGPNDHPWSFTDKLMSFIVDLPPTMVCYLLCFLGGVLGAWLDPFGIGLPRDGGHLVLSVL